MHWIFPQNKKIYQEKRLLTVSNQYFYLQSIPIARKWFGNLSSRFHNFRLLEFIHEIGSLLEATLPISVIRTH